MDNSLNLKNATPADFDAMAKKCAKAFWFWSVITAIIGYFFGWWAVIPAIAALLSALNSVASTRYAAKLRKGDAVKK